MWEREKAIFEAATPEEKEEILASKRARQARYRRKNKQISGYANKQNSQLAQIRTMERMGNATEEQLEYLRQERDKNRVRQMKSREKRRDKLKTDIQRKRT